MYLAIGALQGRVTLLSTLTSVAVISCYFIGAAAFNHLFDVDIDRLNQAWVSDRPLVSGRGSARSLVAIGAVASLLAVVLAMTVSFACGLMLAVGVILAFSYSAPKIRLCARGALTTALLPIFYVAIPFLVGVQSSHARFSFTCVTLLAGGYLIFTGRILLKDFRDVQGDVLYGKRTFLLRYGRRVTCWTGALAWFVGTLVLAFAVSTFTALALLSLVAGAVFCFSQLSRPSDMLRDQEIIDVLGKLGSGVLLSILIQFTVVPTSQLLAQALVMAFVLTFAMPAFVRVSVPNQSPQTRQAA